jgi:hypothetical protein
LSREGKEAVTKGNPVVPSEVTTEHSKEQVNST